MQPCALCTRTHAGSLPASNAAVISALVRRCKELQAALVEASEQLAQARLSLEGLKRENNKVRGAGGVLCPWSVSVADGGGGLQNTCLACSKGVGRSVQELWAVAG